jgi:protein-S-isoprenylcysteine O-methyltransferase Ste14
MYLGAILLFLTWAVFLPHWIIVLISISNAAIVYWFMLEGERHNITKYGDTYRRYMIKVPRMNILAGIIRSLKR